MYNSNILDPIHGLIKVSEIEKWIFSQKPFNRLRRIKQNTFLYLVFPSANHTRFEHSIGVMHLAHQIYLNANENYSTGSFKKAKYLLKETTTFRFYSVTESLKDNEPLYVQELRIAALLHDVGHGPMSHLFDHYALNGEDFMDIVNSDEELMIYSENFLNLLNDLSKKIKHEAVSCLFVIKIVNHLKEIDKAFNTKFNPEQKKIIEALSACRIIQMIEPDFFRVSKLTLNGIDFSDFFSSIISSFPLDADRMDYMARDSYFTGVNYGLYDKSRLLMSFIPVILGAKVSLAIKESGIDSVIRFIQSRTHLYNQIYFHKTNRAANSMLDFACKGIEQGEKVIEAKNYDELLDFYWRNSDELFQWETLKNKIKISKHSEVLDELLERNLVKRIFQHKIILVGISKSELEKINSNLSDLVARIESKAQEHNFDILVDTFPNRVFKDVEKSKIKIISKVADDYQISEDWKKFNTEMTILEHEVIMFRIYVRGKEKKRELFNEKKQEILKNLESLLLELDEIKQSF
jgi:HD superfamily phosphohydrolase